MTMITINAEQEVFDEQVKVLKKELETVAKQKGKPLKDVVEEFDHWVQVARDNEIGGNVNDERLVESYDNTIRFLLANEFENDIINGDVEQSRMGDLFIVADKDELDDKIFQLITKGDN